MAGSPWLESQRAGLNHMGSGLLQPQTPPVPDNTTDLLILPLGSPILGIPYFAPCSAQGPECCFSCFSKSTCSIDRSCTWFAAPARGSMVGLNEEEFQTVCQPFLSSYYWKAPRPHIKISLLSSQSQKLKAKRSISCNLSPSQVAEVEFEPQNKRPQSVLFHTAMAFPLLCLNWRQMAAWSENRHPSSRTWCVFLRKAV